VSFEIVHAPRSESRSDRISVSIVSRNETPLRRRVTAVTPKQSRLCDDREVDIESHRATYAQGLHDGRTASQQARQTHILREAHVTPAISVCKRD
jgi:hypothetical protein